MEQNKNIPAFPLAFQEQDASGMPRTEMYAHDGMTLRDYFAIHANQDDIEQTTHRSLSRSAKEILVGRPYPTKPANRSSVDEHVRWQIEAAKWDAELSAALRFIYADAMLSARGAYQPDQSYVDTSMWDACNPGCDLEFNGSKDRHCSCEPAKAAMLTARENDMKQITREEFSELLSKAEQAFADAGAMGLASRCITARAALQAAEPVFKVMHGPLGDDGTAEYVKFVSLTDADADNFPHGTELFAIPCPPAKAQGEIAEVLKEMRARKINRGKNTSPTLEAWADRIEAALLSRAQEEAER